MHIKYKPNCKLFKQNNRYYVESDNFLDSFKEYQDAIDTYNNIRDIKKNKDGRYFKDERLQYKFYPEDVFLICHALELLKFFLDKSMFYECSREELESKSLDVFLCYQRLISQYNEYLSSEEREKISHKNKILKIG